MLASGFVAKVVMADPIYSHAEKQIAKNYDDGWAGFEHDVWSFLKNEYVQDCQDGLDIAVWKAIHLVMKGGMFLCSDEEIKEQLFEPMGFPKDFDYETYSNYGCSGCFELYCSIMADALICKYEGYLESQGLFLEARNNYPVVSKKAVA